jgi:hypothetical protein
VTAEIGVRRDLPFRFALEALRLRLLDPAPIDRKRRGRRVPVEPGEFPELLKDEDRIGLLGLAVALAQVARRVVKELHPRAEVHQEVGEGG